ncbi:MAG: TIGR02281 family clan AA aspartic protease, partial [Pseudomonadota bacterium]
MLFWPIAALTCGITILVAMRDRLVDETAQVAIDPRLALILLLISTMAVVTFARAHYAGRSRRSHAVAWGLAFVVAAGAYTWRDEGRLLFHRAVTPATPVMVAEETGENRAELLRAWDGHYRAMADVNGAEISLLIDTGASVVLLRHADAVRVGLDPATFEYNVPVTTANGRTRIAAIELGEVRIGSVVLQDVRAAVAEPGKLHTSLLGMSFLERLSETSI